MPARERIEVLFSADSISARVQGLAHEIKAALTAEPLIIAILKGSFVFAADLIRALHKAGVAPEVDFLTLASYHAGTTSSGVVTVLRDVTMDARGRDVLIVDDILESGRTLAFAVAHLKRLGARSVHTCVLLDKAKPRAAEVLADFKAFACPDHFVIGYGMDRAHRFRELPYIGYLIEEPPAS